MIQQFSRDDTPLPANLDDAKVVEEIVCKLAAREIAGKTAAWHTG